MSGGVSITAAGAGHAPAIAAVYNAYVRDSIATFEVDEVADADMAARIARVRDAGLPYLVAEQGGEVLGFAYAGPFQEREAYRHSVEATVYLADSARGRGVGSALYDALHSRLAALTPEQSRHAPVHRAYARIALPNDASVALHEKHGYARAALLTEVGRKFDRWIDVGFWEKPL